MRSPQINCQCLVSLAERCLALAKVADEPNVKGELIDIAEILLSKVRAAADTGIVVAFPRAQAD